MIQTDRLIELVLYISCVITAPGCSGSHVRFVRIVIRGVSTLSLRLAQYP